MQRGDSQTVYADTGVFLTENAGLTWRRISPAENRELQPVVSIAFDPKNANILYVGTPHLPWKTNDGGSSWRSVHLGMIDDRRLEEPGELAGTRDGERRAA